MALQMSAASRTRFDACMFKVLQSKAHTRGQTVCAVRGANLLRLQLANISRVDDCCRVFSLSGKQQGKLAPSMLRPSHALRPKDVSLCGRVVSQVFCMV